jgi:hypothetical protein
MKTSPTVRPITYRKGEKLYSAFQVDWLENGKRKRQQFPKEQDAKLFASEQLTALHNEGSAHRSRSTILTDEVLRECEHAVARLGKYSVMETVEFFLAHHRQSDFQIRLSDAMAGFLSSQVGVNRQRSIEEYRRSLVRFQDFTHDPFVHEVTNDLVEAYMSSLRAKGGVDKASQKTWNIQRGQLHGFFNWCLVKPQGYIAINPVADIKRFKIDQDSIHSLSAAEAERVMRYAEEFKGGRLARYFALALFAGVRPSYNGELGKLSANPSVIDMENGVIKLSAQMTKTRQPRPITIQPNLREWLLRYDGPILPINWEADVKNIRASVGLNRPEGRDILRHTFCSAHIMAFGSFAGTAIESGNSEEIIRKHYLNVTTKNDALKFWSILPAAGAAKVIPFAA